MSDTLQRAVTIRQPATANLMVDSADRNSGYPNPFDFQITRPNSILNGFFNRIGTTEVVLEWNEPNGAVLAANDTGTQVLISTAGGLVSTTVSAVFGPYLFYNSSNALESFARRLGASFGGALISSFFVSTPVYGLPALFASAPVDSMLVSTSATSQSLGLQSAGSLAGTPYFFSFMPIRAPDLRPYRYLDFTSAQLTYNQDLKDSSTSALARDVLCRWYMDWDQQPQRDGFGFPIEMGYEPFKLRRLFNPPKQIRWDSSQPVGNISFQVYGNNVYSSLASTAPVGSPQTNFLMTLQASEN